MVSGGRPWDQSLLLIYCIKIYKNIASARQGFQQSPTGSVTTALTPLEAIDGDAYLQERIIEIATSSLLAHDHGHDSSGTASATAGLSPASPVCVSVIIHSFGRSKVAAASESPGVALRSHPLRPQNNKQTLNGVAIAYKMAAGGAPRGCRESAGGGTPALGGWDYHL